MIVDSKKAVSLMQGWMVAGVRGGGNDESEAGHC